MASILFSSSSHTWNAASSRGQKKRLKRKRELQAPWLEECAKQKEVETAPNEDPPQLSAQWLQESIMLIPPLEQIVFQSCKGEDHDSLPDDEYSVDFATSDTTLSVLQFVHRCHRRLH